VKTPELIPVATKATVKSLSNDDLIDIGAQILICNTYHLMLQPGAEIIEGIGGLHKFMNWEKPLITDSGGFQAFSLGLGKEHAVGKMFFPGEENNMSKIPGKSIAKISYQGIRFKSIYDKSYNLLTPESSIKIQEKLGADMILSLDECTSPLSDKKYTSQSLDRTHNWAIRCINAHNTDQALIGIIQGGHWHDLRKKSVNYISSLNFDSFAIGGSLGKSKKHMHKILEWIIPNISENKSRHLLGIGVVEDIFESVERGIDLFDCVSPTRIARNGLAYIHPPNGTMKNKYRFKLISNKYKNDSSSIDQNCNCKMCEKYSRSYVSHLLKTKELLGYKIISYHNLYFMLQFMRDIREAIDNGTYFKLKRNWLQS
jgi:queuine tRNA-ribosyltransferase/7-cyano-7-deazaguanine tRNA-ribosyltransferase